MKYLIPPTLFTFLLLGSASNPIVAAGVIDEANDLTASEKSEFLAWFNQHGKSYPTYEEARHRLSIWKNNHEFIQAHNSRQPPASFTVGHNQFSDMTLDEYLEYNKLGPYSPGRLEMTNKPSPWADEREQQQPLEATIKVRRRRTAEKAALPELVDWVEAGGVVPVKNQGMCGSCWAFSAIVAIEGAHFVDTGDLIALSEQELIDCDKLDFGCGGGLMDNAFLFDENSTGICSETDYPYVMHKRWLRGCGSLKGECVPVEHTRVKSFIDVENTVDALMEAIADQPVAVAIEADQQSFQFYKSGVYDDVECGNNLDHGVAAVGYGTSEDGKDYFKVRNSWGDTWGDQGYILMARDSPNVNGTCGILQWPSRPILRDD